MKQEIRYKASQEVIELITRWQIWLRDERRYSAHTLDAYSRDLSCFFEFIQEYLDRTPTLADLQKAEVRLFRAFLSSRAARHIEKSSIARELSTLKNFYHWLARNNIVENPAIEVISSPRRAKVLPRAVDVDDAFNVLDITKDFSKKNGRVLEMSPFLQYYTDVVCEFLKPCHSTWMILIIMISSKSKAKATKKDLFPFCR